MADRRRVNGPGGGTTLPSWDLSSFQDTMQCTVRPPRSRGASELRKIFLKTGLTPSASGSAYFEIEAPVAGTENESLIPTSSTLKLACTVHGPKPLPRSAPFSSNTILSTHVKFAPFASRLRRGYVRDSTERDLSVHLETALRGAIIADRWPKSGVDVIVTVLEGEENEWWGGETGLAPKEDVGHTTTGMMSILSGCITVASAAIVDAGIDCVDLVAGGVAALVRPPRGGSGETLQIVLDPAPSDDQYIVASCVVGYLKSRDELTEVWLSGSIPTDNKQGENGVSALLEGAVQAACASQRVLVEVIKESIQS